MRRTKKEKTLTFVIAILAIVLIACVVIGYMGYRRIKDMEATQTAMQDEMDRNQQTVYVTTEDIKQGDQLIDGTNIAKQKIYSGLDSSFYMTEDQLGYKALVAIPLGDAVQLNMIGENEVKEDDRDYEVDVATLMTNQKDSDVVDVRIMFPDGSDYIILSKKTVHDLSLKNSIFYTNLSEDEILRMASATIDAYQTDGAKIYTTRYLQPTLQEESIPFYPVKQNVIDLINSDPNILEEAQETLNASARMDLEDRLAEISEEDQGKITSAQSEQQANVQQAVDESAADEDYTAEETTADTDVTDTTDTTDSDISDASDAASTDDLTSDADSFSQNGGITGGY